MEDWKERETERQHTSPMTNNALRKKYHKERFLWMGLTIILVMLMGALLIKQQASYKSKLSRAQQQEKRLPTEIEGLKRSFTQTQQQKTEIPSQSSSSLQRWDVEKLKAKGLREPIQEIKADLMKHRELIPYEGVLGGKMGFYNENGIQILDSRWVLAAFEDGHIGGRMLLEYQVSNGGQISWKVLDSYLEN